MAIGSRVGAGNACGNGTGSPSSGGGDACSGKEIAAVWPIVADDDGTAGSTAIGAGWTTGGSPWPSGPGTIGVAPGVCGGTVWITGGALCTTRSEEHTSELQSLMRISYAVFCLKKNTRTQRISTL